MWPLAEGMQFLAVYVSDVEETEKARDKERKLTQDRIEKDEIQCDKNGRPYKVQVKKYIGA